MNALVLRISNLSLIFYYTVAYFAVGLTEEEYHIRKAGYWTELGSYRRAIRNYQKSLNCTEDSRVRAAMAWCYSEIGLIESSREHYRRAFERNRSFDIVLGLAYAELNLENYPQVQAMLDILKAEIGNPTEHQSSEIARLKSLLESQSQSNERPA
jgi:tetratricopeptide (TPR) repeat protein